MEVVLRDDMQTEFKLSVEVWKSTDRDETYKKFVIEAPHWWQGREISLDFEKVRKALKVLED